MASCISRTGNSSWSCARIRLRASMDTTLFRLLRPAPPFRTGLRGEGGFEGDFGKGSDGWLDYWFE